MKQKRLGLVVANILPILIFAGEVALILHRQIGWSIAIAAIVAAGSFVLFCFFPYGEEVVFVTANVGYAVSIILAWLINFIDPSVTPYIGVLFTFITLLLQGILTTERTQGRI